MPLMKGKFDPKQFNSTELAHQLYEVETGAMWNDATEDVRMRYIDLCQRILDNLWYKGVIQ